MPFAFVANIDKNEFIVDPQNLAVKNRIDCQRGGPNRVFTRFSTGHGEFEFLIEFISEFKFTNQIAVNHTGGDFGKKMGWRKEFCGPRLKERSVAGVSQLNNRTFYPGLPSLPDRQPRQSSPEWR